MKVRKFRAHELDEHVLRKTTELIYSTGEDQFDFVFDGKSEATTVIKDLFLNDRGLFSHEEALWGIEDGTVAGILVGHHGHEEMRHTLSTIVDVCKLFWRKPRYIFRFLWRFIQLQKISKRTPRDSYYIAHFALLPEFHGRRLGAAFMEQVLPILNAERGVRRCCLDVATDNTRAIKLYERLGFKIQRTLRHEKFQERYPKLKSRYRMFLSFKK